MKALWNQLRALFLAVGALWRTFTNQKIGFAFPLILLIFIISLFFAFLSAVPVLSPFVYPLF